MLVISQLLLLALSASSGENDGATRVSMCYAPWNGSRARFGSAAFAQDALDSADVVVRARLVGADSARPSEDVTGLPERLIVASEFRVLRFEVLERLKGVAPDTLHIEGRIVPVHPVNTGPFPYAWPRHGGGMCFAYEYRMDGEYLFLLARDVEHSRLTPYWASMSLSGEAVRSQNDPWLDFARRHLSRARKSAR
jgi:hypothetical protein